MGYLESTLTGEEKIEFKFEFHWSVWTVPTIGVILAPDTAGFTLVFAFFSETKFSTKSKRRLRLMLVAFENGQDRPQRTSILEMVPKKP